MSLNLRMFALIATMVLSACTTTSNKAVPSGEYEKVPDWLLVGYQMRDKYSNTYDAYERAVVKAKNYPGVKAESLYNLVGLPPRTNEAIYTEIKLVQKETLRINSDVANAKARIKSDIAKAKAKAQAEELRQKTLLANGAIFINEFSNSSYKKFTSDTCIKISKAGSMPYMRQSKFETDHEFNKRKELEYKARYGKFISPVFYIDTKAYNSDYDLETQEWVFDLRGGEYKSKGRTISHGKVFSVTGLSKDWRYSGNNVFGVKKEVMAGRYKYCKFDSKDLAVNQIRFKMPLKKAKAIGDLTQRVYFSINSYEEFFELETKENKPTISNPLDVKIETYRLSADIKGVIYHHKGKPIKGYKL